MACINPDGTLTPSAQAILEALRRAPAKAEALAQQAGLPLYRVRSSMRELVVAGLVVETAEGYALTEQGRARTTSA
ncbi:MAG: hypothetical protein RMN25_12125 [Anaerolineae bacterium]|nr:hypothetical protein [Thermoflexales bacterium]MDW8408518.1 hypothetical protein [Anaerolineae bacterium]